MAVEKIGLRKKGASFALGDQLYPVTDYNFLVNRPATFTPTAHTHVKANITDFPSSMPASDVYAWAKATVKPSYAWTEISSKPSVIIEGDSRLTNSRPASDVYAWAKAASKPAYTPGEIGTMTTAEINAAVSAAISAAINGAPGALDTLNELAAAIGDDPNFATTMTNALAGKMSTSHPANNITATHLYMSNGDGFVWDDTGNIMYVRKDATDYQLVDAGNFSAIGIAAITDLDNYEPKIVTKNSAFNKSFGTAAGTVTQGNDSRLSDARTPLAHTHTKAQITDFPATMPPTAHTHTKANITDFPTSMPASDVYAWAKSPLKPTYSPSEIGATTEAYVNGEVSGLATYVDTNFLAIGGKAADSEKLDNLDSSQFIRSDVSDTAAGNHEFYATDTDGSYDSAAVEIREVGLVASAQSADAYAPSIAWHWGGRVQNKIYLKSNGEMWINGSQNGKLLHTGNLTSLSQLTNDVGYLTTDNNTWRGIDDTPVNGQTAESISSNWAYDHVNSSTAHPRDTRNQIAGSYAAATHTHTKAQITDFPVSMPASDVYTWAKSASKPSYTAAEVGALSTTGKAADADKLDGLNLNSITRNNQANTVMRTNASGYAEFGWINTTSGATTNAVTDVYVNTNDGYIRKKTLALFKTELGSMPASDVSAWAKAATKPSYTAAEVGAVSQSYVDNTFLPLGGTAANATKADLIDVNSYDGTTLMRILGSHQTGSESNVYSTAGVYVNMSTDVIYAAGGNSGEWNTAYDHSQAAHAPSNANYYAHPTYAGDDINIDTGVLTGSQVISDLDFNVTTDTGGHVTDANGVETVRNLDAIRGQHGTDMKFWKGTLTAYNAITTKDANTMYVIVN